MIEKNEMIFGVRAVIEALDAGKEIDKILIKRDMQSDLSRELFAALRGRMIPVQRVPVERIDRITRKNHQGVVAFVSPITYQLTEDIVPFLFEQGKSPLLLMLDGITDVRNFGAIARTCECAGVDAIIIPAKNSVTVNADAVKGDFPSSQQFENQAKERSSEEGNRQNLRSGGRMARRIQEQQNQERKEQ